MSDLRGMSQNIWVAAGDGDLRRVRILIEQEHISPNTPDPFSYTPMHAAASYGHLDVLQYLISQGGDVNITDSDGDTPLFTVENEDSAKFLIEHGANLNITNNEGLSPIEHLAQDFPKIADYLRSTLPNDGVPPHPVAPVELVQPSQLHQNVVTEDLTSSLIHSVQEIMQRAELAGRDPEEEELREAVSRTVLEGVAMGYHLTSNTDAEPANPTPVKRPRTDDGQNSDHDRDRVV